MTIIRCRNCGKPTNRDDGPLCVECLTNLNLAADSVQPPVAPVEGQCADSKADAATQPDDKNPELAATGEFRPREHHTEFSVPSDAAYGLTPNDSLDDHETMQFSGSAQIASQRRSADEFQPRQFGEYHLIQELGRGGMGVVFKALQNSVDRPVAVKMIIAGRLASENDIERFYQEARSAGKLRHPNIVQVHQAGELEGHHFFSMDFIEGENLAVHRRHRSLSYDEIAEIMIKISEAIQFAHSKGVLHRDLKPPNVLIDVDGEPHVTDFGLAKDIHNDSQITTEGSALGTPSYMSPEQAQAKHDELDARTDVYSLGAILYELLTGVPPFKGDSPFHTLMMVIQQRPVAPRAVNKECPRDLEAICVRCLEKDPQARYASAQELADDLERFRNEQVVMARRTRWFERASYWLRDVPLIAAIIGRRTPHPTKWHYRTQWLALAGLSTVVALAIWQPDFSEGPRLRVIDMATGPQGGSYARLADTMHEQLSTAAARSVRLQSSPGAVASQEMLLRGTADLAFLQENTLTDRRVQVVAPLYYEVVLVLVRKESLLTDIRDLAQHSIVLGPRGSGMRRSGEELLKRLGVDIATLRDTNRDFDDLISDVNLDGAIITSKLDDQRTVQTLASEAFRILPIRQAERIPGFRAFTVDRSDVPEQIRASIPLEGLTTAATFAVLAVRDSAPRWFVSACLKSLYESDLDFTKQAGLFAQAEAAAWGDLNLHPVAREYFRQSTE